MISRMEFLASCLEMPAIKDNESAKTNLETALILEAVAVMLGADPDRR
jgi:hypothetical protein